MELSSSSIKKFLIFWEMELFSQARKNKKKKISYTWGIWNFLILILKNFLYFLERKLFLYFGKRKPRKKSLYFRKRNFLIFQEVTFQARKVKRTHAEKISYIS